MAVIRGSKRSMTSWAACDRQGFQSTQPFTCIIQAAGLGQFLLALENQLRTVKRMLYDQRDAFTNRERTTLALGLMRLHLLELDDQHDYQRAIREELVSNDA